MLEALLGCSGEEACGEKTEARTCQDAKIYRVVCVQVNYYVR